MTDTYTLGPISAGSDSPLGQLFGFAQGISQNFAVGQQVYVNNPGLAGSIISGQATEANLSPAGIAALQTAATTPRTSNPFVALGQDLGSILGSGATGLGTIIGVGGKTAGPGVAAGASGASSGILTGVTSAIGGAASGILPGISAGIENALGLPGGGGSSILVLVLGGLAVIALFLLLK